MTATPIDAASAPTAPAAAPKAAYSENYRRLVLFLLVTA
jgi:hypothetical protein